MISRVVTQPLPLRTLVVQRLHEIWEGDSLLFRDLADFSQLAAEE